MLRTSPTSSSREIAVTLLGQNAQKPTHRFASRCIESWHKRETLGMIHAVAHSINRKAFANCDTTQPFFRLYTLLVAIELALKDGAPKHQKGHDLEVLARAALQPLPAGLSAMPLT